MKIIPIPLLNDWVEFQPQFVSPTQPILYPKKNNFRLLQGTIALLAELFLLLIFWQLIKVIFMLWRFTIAGIIHMTLICDNNLKRPLADTVVGFDLEILLVLVVSQEMVLKIKIELNYKINSVVNWELLNPDPPESKSRSKYESAIIIPIRLQNRKGSRTRKALEPERLRNHKGSGTWKEPKLFLKKKY